MIEKSEYQAKQSVIAALARHIDGASSEEIKRVLGVLVDRLPSDFVQALDLAYGLVDEPGRKVEGK